jgi:sulfur carrier protein ThiS
MPPGAPPDPVTDLDLPRLTVALPAGWTDWEATSWVQALVAAGADALLVGLDAAADPDLARRAISRLKPDPPPTLHILVENSPALAAAVDAGVLLAERGVSTAEARRTLGPGRLLGRVVGSPTAAAAAAGADVLVVEEAATEPQALRAIVEAAWVPVLASSSVTDFETGNEGPGLVGLGFEGIVLQSGPETTPSLLASAVAAVRTILPAAWFASTPAASVAPVILVDGVAHPLPPETAVTDLLADLGRESATSVAVNGVPVARRRWDDTLLAPGDDVRVTSG